ncbi:Spo0E family sporulation regulatory protein-aspartic acid phosphatase [Cytobacillus sp. Hz8]|uniref:Spo0E family sporulation regulatory protein-aspartic acid phosphatase n=1 Tax=Cytobacillus sp. Hz8 TaxID=3347168 RepID=UPI0035DFA997
MYQTSNEILKQIKIKREKMIISAEKSGFTSDDTLKYSQELDQLILEYQRNFQGEIYDNEVNISMRQMMFVCPKMCI